MKNAVEVSQKRMRTAIVDEEIYFGPMALKYKDGSV